MQLILPVPCRESVETGTYHTTSWSLGSKKDSDKAEVCSQISFY